MRLPADPNSSRSRLAIITYSGAELLDVTGPVSVFSTANQLAEKALYEIVLLSPSGGLSVHSGGIALDTLALAQFSADRHDTVLVVGAVRPVLLRAMQDQTMARALVAASQKAKRFGSVCSGAFVLGAAGLLDGQSATTHWAAQAELAERFPKASVAADTLYVQSGRLWTSAGVTAGIDMALAMVCADHGRELGTAVARNLVVYAHRPGNQSQFSAVMAAQSAGQARFAPLIDWVLENLGEPVRVEDMAQKVAMSPRSFYRKFTANYGVTPAKFVERLRLERARDLVAEGVPVKRVFMAVGFRSEAAFRQAFKSHFGVPPSVMAHLSA